jgi:hypothetical protein
LTKKRCSFTTTTTIHSSKPVHQGWSLKDCLLYMYDMIQKKKKSLFCNQYIMFFSWFISLASARTRRSWVHGTKVLVFLINL